MDIKKPWILSSRHRFNEDGAACSLFTQILTRTKFILGRLPSSNCHWSGMIWVRWLWCYLLFSWFHTMSMSLVLKRSVGFYYREVVSHSSYGCAYPRGVLRVSIQIFYHTRHRTYLNNLWPSYELGSIGHFEVIYCFRSLIRLTINLSCVLILKF